MSAHYEGHGVFVHHGDCLDVLRSMSTASVDAVVTDPPYGLEFMGKDWDAFKPSSARLRTRIDGRTNPSEGKSVTTTPEAYVAGHPFQAWCEEWAAECLRVLKPGGHMLAFGGTRTVHRLACAVEDAGFEIRDRMRVETTGAELPPELAWEYGSGFPKSLDVSKAIDKAAGVEREVIGRATGRAATPRNDMRGGAYGSTPAGLIDTGALTAPATDDAARWNGWGTALKPAYEPIIVARKPLAGTVAATVTAYGTGALNIAGCRVPHDEPAGAPHVGNGGARSGGIMGAQAAGARARETTAASTAGRWPANVVLLHASTCAEDCVEGCPVAELDAQSGTLASGANPTRRGSDRLRDAYGDFKGQEDCTPARGADSGGASRFFPTFRYEAKADATERPRAGSVAHPTVKPLDLMRWLVRLVTPPGGLVLDPFAGSGTTAEACLVEGFRCVTIEREADYLPLIVDRITKRADPVANLTAKVERGEDVDLGLFGLLEDGAA